MSVICKQYKCKLYIQKLINSNITDKRKSTICRISYFVRKRCLRYFNLFIYRSFIIIHVLIAASYFIFKNINVITQLKGFVLYWSSTTLIISTAASRMTNNKAESDYGTYGEILSYFIICLATCAWINTIHTLLKFQRYRTHSSSLLLSSQVIHLLSFFNNCILSITAAK